MPQDPASAPVGTLERAGQNAAERKHLEIARFLSDVVLAQGLLRHLWHQFLSADLPPLHLVVCVAPAPRVCTGRKDFTERTTQRVACAGHAVALGERPGTSKS